MLICWIRQRRGATGDGAADLAPVGEARGEQGGRRPASRSKPRMKRPSARDGTARPSRVSATVPAGATPRTSAPCGGSAGRGGMAGSGCRGGGAEQQPATRPGPQRFI